MDKIIAVSVTQEDIDEGVPREPTSCPIADALARLGYVSEVYSNWVGIFEKEDFYIRNLPTIARIFIREFDEGDNVHPFEFELT